MKKIITIIAVATLTLFCSGQASAQHTSKGYSVISAQYNWNFTGWGWGELNYGQYLLHGYWQAGVSFTERQAVALDQKNTERTLDYQQLRAGGDYMYRLFGSRSRAFNFYLGCGAFVGCEFTDIFKKWDSTELGVPATNGNKFIFGVQPKAQMELYLGRVFGLILTGSIPMSFLSQYTWFNGELQAGVRFTF